MIRDVINVCNADEHQPQNLWIPRLHHDHWPGEGNSEVPQSDNASGWAEMAFNGAYKERILDGCECMFVGPL